MNNNFMIPTPDQFRIAEKKDNILKTALDMIQETIKKKKYVQQKNKKNLIELLLFTSNPFRPTIEDVEKMETFTKIFSAPFFPQNEFDKNLANFGWKLTKHNTWYFLVEIK